VSPDSASRAADGLLLDDDRIGLPPGCSPDMTYDVLINDRHVWSIQPARDTDLEQGRAVAAWPKALRRYLHGRAEVQLREHVSGEVVASGRHVFGGATDREVTVIDRSGHALVLDKWGRLTRPLSDEHGDVVDQLMTEVLRLLEVLRDRAGVPAFICYGTLLGAVRNGRLIGHDNDLDIAYLSELPHPVDVVREGFRVERVLKEAGWVVRRGSGVRLNVRLRLPDGSMRFVDVFTAHWVEGVLYIPSDTGFRLPRTTILPLTTVELMGHEVPAPADSETLLAHTYGERWRVPDPSFKYDTPRWLSRRFGGWFGGLKSHRKQWDTFYAGGQRRKVPTTPSAFARWVAAEHPSSRPLVDLGSGTGRDALWFAREHGRRVTGLDYSFSTVRRCNQKAARKHLPAEFEVLNFYDLRPVLTLGALLAREEEPADLYARFLLHALDPAGVTNVLRLASMSLRRGGHLFLEFRTPRDRRRPHFFADHQRTYPRPAEVVEEIEALGGTIVHRSEGTGLAPFRDEDPYVCRLVARWGAGA
jgi:SAM-dependent methyltransferase